MKTFLLRLLLLVVRWPVALLTLLLYPVVCLEPAKVAEG